MEENRIQNQIAIYMTNKKLCEFTDKLKPAPVEYYAFLDKARELTGISIEAFCAETPYDIGMAMYKLNEAYQDKFSFYIYHNDELKTLDEWIRETDLSGSFYFGGTLDYHF